MGLIEPQKTTMELWGNNICSMMAIAFMGLRITHGDK
jgi:hypothetical protein